MARIVKGTLVVSSINGRVEINNTALNHVLVNKTWSFKDGVLEFDYQNIHVEASAKRVVVKKLYKDGRVITSGTNSVDGARGRFVRCKSPVDDKPSTINISRLWLIAYHLEAGHIVIADVDKLVINHLDNKGNEEGCIGSKEGLDVGNYELVSQQLNKIHGDTWYKIYGWGDEAKFSALDSVFITLVNLSDTKEQLLALMKAKGLNPADYQIKEVI